jgi:hypothetical protein
MPVREKTEKGEFAASPSLSLVPTHERTAANCAALRV